MPITTVYDNTCVSQTGRCCAWVVPDGVTSVYFEIWGGGGGAGGGLTMCDCCSRTQGGGGGGYAAKTVAVTPGSTYTICAGNAGIASDGSNFGANTGYCQNGVPGGTSFVSGPGLTGFCATGGQGGCSNFTINCYGHCGCNGANGGAGFGGDITETGYPGVKGSSGSPNARRSYSFGGAAAGVGGGVGGVNNGGSGPGRTGDANSSPYMHGNIPGGGGAGHGCWTNCECYSCGAGRGAPGFVKITW